MKERYSGVPRQSDTRYQAKGSLSLYKWSDLNHF